MTDVKNAFCPKIDCKDYGLQNHGNIAIRGKYGKKRNLLTKKILVGSRSGQR